MSEEQIRQLIRDRLRDLRMSDTELSRRVDRNPGWTYDYLRGDPPRPKRLSMELALAIAQALELDPAAIGVRSPEPQPTAATGSGSV